MRSYYINENIVDVDICKKLYDIKKSDNIGLITKMKIFYEGASALISLMKLKISGVHDIMEEGHRNIIKENFISSYDKNIFFTGLRLAWICHTIFRQDGGDSISDMNIDIMNDMVVIDPISTIHKPAMSIVIDHTYCNIAICFRGTSDINDIMTDLNYDIRDIGYGNVHNGMYESAYQFHMIYKSLIKWISKKYPLYELKITGHSLGGGVAILVGHMLLPEYPTLSVYTFGCPCVISGDLLSKIEKFTYSFIYQDDIVSRLSKISVDNIQNHIMDRPISYEPYQLLPAGKIYQLDFMNGIVYVQSDIPPTSYNKIVLSSNMIQDHMLDTYIIALQNVLNNHI